MLTPQSVRLFLVISSVLTFNVIFQTGCKHMPVADMEIPPDDTTTVVTGTPCNPDSIYFSVQILPILVSNCAMDQCHSAKNPQDNVNLTSYTQVMQTGDIQPGQLNGDLWEAINESDPDDRMPRPPSPPLNAEQINLIKLWILQGAKDLQCDPDNGGCSTIEMSFVQHIQPILNNSCIGCHSGNNPSGGINLSTFTGVSAVAVSGRLTGAIKKQPGYTAMPPAGNALSSCNVQKIEAWIDQGLKNN